jgi:L-threonylcarbamoyladenylate synthase
MLQTALDVLGLDAKNIATYSRSILRTPAPNVLRRHMPQDAAAAAHELFAVLRQLDAQGVNLIWVESPPNTPEWDGVRDRLQRAAAA